MDDSIIMWGEARGWTLAHRIIMWGVANVLVAIVARYYASFCVKQDTLQSVYMDTSHMPTFRLSAGVYMIVRSLRLFPENFGFGT